MSAARLTLALDAGIVALPEEGTIATLGPVVEQDLWGLPKDRTVVISRDRLVHDALGPFGYDRAETLPEDVAVVIVFLPRARDLARAHLHAAMRSGAEVLVNGAKVHGVDSLYREIGKHAAVSPAWSKAHGKVFSIAAGQEPPAQWAEGQRTIEGGFVTAPGIFSADGPDKASVLLAAEIEGLSGHVVDLGAGWGFLAKHALGTSEEITKLDLVEADGRALDCARMNLDDPRAAFHWADATRWTPEKKPDVIITNPPFHQGRNADPALGQAFIAAAAGMLAPKGQLLLVANRHLPYEVSLAERFGQTEEIGGDRGFKILRAAKPRH
ncbi:16S rRNA m(2)G 1207 methyltransferase [Poseidonocella pacifica]|uniref:16S rRNA m(2)G 1207 methyltransferase n=1 Tax=Poseidonocella pacifica TaxID=871651 RepID=A0A1I0XL06_9RHOB|nr:methyltransferase [Poseidonocella pacifica]SFB00633.1 16S rRNA m(2)G 1207 methyltransferase [Poseidonocella pacifica]